LLVGKTETGTCPKVDVEVIFKKVCFEFAIDCKQTKKKVL